MVTTPTSAGGIPPAPPPGAPSLAPQAASTNATAVANRAALPGGREKEATEAGVRTAIWLNWVMGKPSLEKIRAQTEKPSEK